MVGREPAGVGRLSRDELRVALERAREQIGDLESDRGPSSERLIDSLAEQMRDGVALLSPEGIHLDVNPALCAMTDFSREELIGVGVPHPYWPPEMCEQIERTLRQNLEEPTGTVEFTFMRKDGARFPVLITPSLLRDEVGAPSCLFAIVRDVSELKRAEEALRESERRFASFARHMPGRLWIRDEELRYIYMNPQLATDLGGIETGFLGKTPEELWNAATAAGAREMCQRALSGEVVDIVERWPDSDESGFFRSLVFAIAGEGGARLLGGLMFDVTQRKRAEEELRESESRLRFLVDQTPTVNWTVDRDLHFTASRGGGLKVLGLEPDQVVGMYVGDYLGAPSAQADLGVAMHERALAGDTFIYEQSVGELAFDIILGPLRDASEAIVGVIGVGYDATERKAAEEALRDSELRYRIVAENAPVGIYESTREGRVLYANAAYADVFGYASPAEMIETVNAAGGTSMLYADPEERRELLQAVRDSGGAWTVRDCHGRHRDGSPLDIRMEISERRDPTSGEHRLFGFGQDVTAQRRAERALQERERNLSTLMGNLPGMAYRCENDPQWTMQFVSAGCEELTGYPPEALVGNAVVSYAKLIEEEDRPGVWEAIEDSVEGKHTWTLQYRIRTAAGETKWVWERGVAVRSADGTVQALEGFITDVTSLKLSEQALRDSEERYGLLFESMLDGFAYCRMLYDEDGRSDDFVYLVVNPAFERITGLTDVVGKRFNELFSTAQADTPEVVETYGRVARTGAPAEFDIDFTPLGLSLHISVFRPEPDHFVAVFADVSEERHAAAALRESEQDFRTLAEAVPQIVWTTDPEGKNTYINQQWVDYTGLTLEESYGDGWNTPFHSDDRQRAWDAWQLAVTKDAPYSLECRLRRADGVYRWWLIRGAPVRDENDQISKWFGTCTDIEDLKQAEASLRESEGRFRSLFEDSPVAVWEEDHAAVKVRLEELLAEGVEDVESYLNDHHDEYERCMRLARTLDANGAAVELFEAESREELMARQDEIYPPGEAGSLAGFWAALLAGRPVAGSEEANLTLEGRKLLVLETASVARGHEDAWDRVYLADVDVSARRLAEQQLREALVRQRDTTTGVIAALSRSVEARDPYTAGHQRRVSELAVAIARELGLDADHVRHVEVAGLLHDVGKIVIPAEILSKPGRLSEIEFNLIKGHSQAACDILAPIDFDFPLAEIVVQHHERLDGSGYPDGLKDGDILPEARILAVADVVEAMISHRPYRPALPIEEALAEIENGAGTRYDAEVCAAAVRLFRDQGFAFSE